MARRAVAGLTVNRDNVRWKRRLKSRYIGEMARVVTRDLRTARIDNHAK